jgi:cupin fold WbuC family metalloprotein
LNYNFHELPNAVQRMLNAISPNTYIAPHRHANPPKTECFIILQGKAAIVLFNKKGDIIDIVILHSKINWGIDIKAGTWHTLLSLEEGTVLFECKDGPYHQEKDKEFAPWAPSEENAEEGQRYLQEILDLVKKKCV